MTIRQMSRFYSGVYNLYKTTYSGGQVTRQTAGGTTKNISSNPLNTIDPSYVAKKNNFDDAMTSLKNSAADVKNLDFGAENSVETVKNFLSDYNGAIKFFDENSSISSRVGLMAKNFADTTYFAKNYSEIGIDVAEDGTMTLDKEKFSAALESDSKKVSRIFGNLASRAESKVSLANLQKNSLFPTVKNFMSSGLYGKNNFLSAYGIGNFLNFWL